MNTYTPFFILSAEVKFDSDAETKQRTKMLSRQLRNLGYAVAECRGSYDGEEETSILVIDETPGVPGCLNDVLRLAELYSQRSILAVDANRRAALVFTKDTERKSLGWFQGCPKEIARGMSCWTERAGRYYVCA